MSNKTKKIINDPVHGFISIPNDLIYKVIEHPYFQRLRRISQLGLTYLVYPGANHTRFHHAIGSMHLMHIAVKTIQNKGFKISNEEKDAVLLAILLHDIGHGPFSHALEKTLVNNLSHEKISKIIMNKLNIEFKGRLSLAIDIFNNNYKRKFFFQLISSQIDIDRLDYLQRDSFFTGVTEGRINSYRIIDMLDLNKDKLVMDHKAAYSIEKFLLARQFMYWQVYLHKTVISAEFTLLNILNRAKELIKNGYKLKSSSTLDKFLKKDFDILDFEKNDKILNLFCTLDDYDIFNAIKEWSLKSEKILSYLCRMLINRNLLKIEIQNDKFKSEYINLIENRLIKKHKLSKYELKYFIFQKKIVNEIYDNDNPILLKLKNNTIVDFKTENRYLNLSKQYNLSSKYFLCYPSDILE